MPKEILFCLSTISGDHSNDAYIHHSKIHFRMQIEQKIL